MGILPDFMEKISLDGEWTVHQKGSQDRFAASVPGCIHTDLLAAGKIENPYYADNENRLFWIGEKSWVYTRKIIVPKRILEHNQLELVSNGLDTIATITINNKIIGASNNAFRTWRFDIRKALRSGANTITVTFDSTFPTAKKMAKKRAFNAAMVDEARLEGSNYIRKSQANYGWDWGPRCVTCGIWRSIHIEAFDTARISDVHITQDHGRADQVSLDVAVETVRFAQSSLLALVKIKYKGEKILGAEFPLPRKISSMQMTIKKPKLWWPNGLGEQPLYEVEVTLLNASRNILDQKFLSIGFRELRLVRRPDKWGESFQFEVNGEPFFAKGANWIPADTFVTRITVEQYEHLIVSAAQANMNMLRVWGGGIYEDEKFYELCDRHGICVWQDFMFACAGYPANDKTYMDNVAEEAKDVIRQLRHHPSLALWCGNNELEQGQRAIGKDPTTGVMTWDEYKSLFDKLLASIVKKLDPQRDYWPSSPHSPSGDRLDFNNPDIGDAHLWEVWHGRKPFEWYRTATHRFVSEFGFQSFPEPEVVKSYTPVEERNITSFVMEHHQRSSIGNQRIIEYLLSWFRLPSGFEMSLWLSQILQGMAIKYAVENWRRIMPRGMGTLIWQLNDCWPVASWSSIDYPGNWKALHYMARDFYAPLLVSGIEDSKKGSVEVFVTNDYRTPKEGIVGWILTDTGGETVEEGTIPVIIAARKSKRVGILKLENHVKEPGARNLMLWLTLDIDGERVSDNFVSFEKPKHLSLKDPKLTTRINVLDGGEYKVTVSAKRPALWTWLDLDSVTASYSDRFFHLGPKQKLEVLVRPKRKLRPDLFEKKLGAFSLYDTYQGRPTL